MSLQDFYGTYEVQNTSGTAFGLDTTVVIADQLADGTIPVSFTPSTGNGGTAAATITVSATYEESTDSLRVAQQGETEVMFISRFVDPTPGSTYQAIYSIVITPPAEDQPRRLRVWSARLTAAASGTDIPVGTDALPQEAFAGNYLVGTTVDSQFGAGSEVTITQQSNGFLSLEIVNALGISITVTTLSYDAAAVAVRGTTNGTLNGPNGAELVPAVVAMSLARVGGESGVEEKYLYGTFIVGDPEQGGTFAGEDDDPVP